MDVDDEEELPLAQGISFRRDVTNNGQHHLHHYHPQMNKPGSYNSMTFNHHRHTQQQVKNLANQMNCSWCVNCKWSKTRGKGGGGILVTMGHKFNKSNFRDVIFKSQSYSKILTTTKSVIAIDFYWSRLLATYINYQLTIWQFEVQNLALNCISL